MKIVMLIFTVISLFLPGCVYAVRYAGPYTGKVLDANSGEPIEGVVVLGVWETVTITPAGGTHNFYDAEETITDKNGDFRVSGQGLGILSNLEPMTAYFFKAGYTYEVIDWSELFKKLHEDIKWEGNKPTISLRKLTMEERKKRRPPSRPSIPHEKMKLLTKEIDKERIAQGFTPFESGGDNK